MIEPLGDLYFMKLAYKEALKAQEAGEVPVGAILVAKNQIIAKAHNQTELLTDVTAHAEMLALTAGSSHIGAKYLHEASIYVTLEPCVMCAGALQWSQIGRIVFAASDEKKGFMRYGKEILHPRTKLLYGIMENECSELLRQFFKERR